MEEIEPAAIRLFHLTSPQAQKLNKSSLLLVDEPPPHARAYLERIIKKRSPDVVGVLGELLLHSEKHLTTFTEFKYKDEEGSTLVETHIFTFSSNRMRILSLGFE